MFFEDDTDEGSTPEPDPTEHEPDPTAHEPEEWDPEEDIGIEIPSVSTDPEDVPKDLRREFWTLVLVFNVALFAVSLGAMLVAFRGQWSLGGGLVAVGLVAFARGYYRYQHREYQ